MQSTKYAKIFNPFPQVLSAKGDLSWICLFLCVISMGCFAGSSEANDLKGVVTKSAILGLPSFARNYEQYQPDEQQIQAMQSLSNKALYVMFGSWCHDSEREVPRLLKLLDTSEVSNANVILIAVDRDKNDATGKSEELGLRYTPTFVVFSGETEVARIIEKPQGDLATDFSRQIATGK
ncbi:MAG: TlpA family protein disulfide reductase [Aestuariibacter sp.]